MGIRTCLILAAAVLLLSCCQGIPAEAAETTTPGSDAYLPLVLRQPTLTPTATPTPEPTATPEPTPAARLQDGRYEGDVASPGDGWIWFDVAEGGTRVVDAGVLVWNGVPMCPWQALVFEGSTKIENGEFTYWSADASSRDVFGLLHCQSWASWWTVCAAIRFGSEHNCGVSGVVVVRR